MSDSRNRLDRVHGLLKRGAFDDAEADLRALLRDDPNSTTVLYLLGVVARARNRPQDALHPLERVLAIEPQNKDALLMYAACLRLAGHADQAAAAYKVVAEASNAADVQIEYARALAAAGRLDTADRVLAAVQSREPKHREVLRLRAGVLRRRHRIAEAARILEELLAADPRDAAAWRSLGLVELNRGRIGSAIAAYRRAADLQPRDPVAASNANMAMLYDDRAAPEEIADAHRAWARRYADPRGNDAHPFANTADPDRQLRVGLVSGDLRTHSVAYFLEPLLEAYDRAALDIACFDSGTRADDTTGRLKTLVDGWHAIAGLGDAEAVAAIRGRAIDVLVDLSGRTIGNRALIFAARAAPVQIAYLGYPATTGMAAMDYRLTDSIADPPGATAHLHSEILLRLDPCFLCYRPRTDAPAVTPPPITTAGAPTFGSFNNTMKLSEATITLWSKLLGAVPRARLVLKFGFLNAPEIRDALRRRFADHGIDAARLDLRPGGGDPASHLAHYRDIDIALDPLPYNGATTTCEALWMGVPVLTVAGAAHVSRVGASLLTAAGLADLVSDDGAALIRKARDLIAAPERLATMRSDMRHRLGRAPLTDGAAFARRFEAALRAAWYDWCAGEHRH